MPFNMLYFPPDARWSHAVKNPLRNIPYFPCKAVNSPSSNSFLYGFTAFL